MTKQMNPLKEKCVKTADSLGMVDLANKVNEIIEVFNEQVSSGRGNDISSKSSPEPMQKCVKCHAPAIGNELEKFGCGMCGFGFDHSEMTTVADWEKRLNRISATIISPDGDEAFTSTISRIEEYPQLVELIDSLLSLQRQEMRESAKKDLCPVEDKDGVFWVKYTDVENLLSDKELLK